MKNKHDIVVKQGKHEWVIDTAQNKHVGRLLREHYLSCGTYDEVKIMPTQLHHKIIE